MKTLVLSMLAMASMAAMTSCSSENDVIDEVNPQGGDKVEIKLTAGTIGVTTKAPINNLTELSAGGKIGIFAIDGTIWNANPRINNQSSSVGVDGTITFDNSKNYYYPSSGDVNFYAYYPYKENITASSDGKAPSVEFTITGQEDLMYATSIIGNKTTPSSTPLAFNHVLTQIQFKVKKGTIPDGVKIQSIKVTGINDKGIMDITTGNITGWSKSSSDVTINPNVTEAVINTEANAGSPIMLQAEQTSFTIEVVTEMGTYSNISVKPTVDSKFAASTAYDVLLTFNASEIGVKASVTTWTPGTGSGTIE